MGGKKKGGAKKGKAGDDDGAVSPDVLYDILKAKVDALKSRIVLEQERRQNALTMQDEFRSEGEKLANDMSDNK